MAGNLREPFPATFSRHCGDIFRDGVVFFVRCMLRDGLHRPNLTPSRFCASTGIQNQSVKA